MRRGKLISCSILLIRLDKKVDVQSSLIGHGVYPDEFFLFSKLNKFRTKISKYITVVLVLITLWTIPLFLSFDRD